MDIHRSQSNTGSSKGRKARHIGPPTPHEFKPVDMHRSQSNTGSSKRERKLRRKKGGSEANVGWRGVEEGVDGGKEVGGKGESKGKKKKNRNHHHS